MSAILSADDLNDFISPGVACIKPVETLPKQEDYNPYEVTTEDKVAAQNPAPASISLTDCLACSGCVTSAEAVLVSLQSHTEVLNTLDSYESLNVQKLLEQQQQARNGVNNGHHVQASSIPPNAKLFVASVSPQVRASLAATYGISERKAGFMIEQFLSGAQGLRIGGANKSSFTYVVDTNQLREACLVLGAEEVSESLSNKKRPVLTSACPGWICYAEKTHPHVLPHLSSLKSPQALSGTLLKSVLSKTLGIRPSQIWHLAIMPCFDKKLEASREELTDRWWRPESQQEQEQTTPVRDVDCVITSRELLSLAEARNIQLSSLPLRPLSSSERISFPDARISNFLFPSPRRLKRAEQSPNAGSSGGYLYQIMATEQANHPGSTISIQRGRNADVVEYFLLSADGTQTLMKCARYYGFRNIQNLVRKLKPAKQSRLPGAARRATAATGGAADYAYVEVMACPGGCTNGGGQIKVDDVAGVLPQTRGEEVATPVTPQAQKEWLRRVDEAYYSADSDVDSDSDLEDTDVDMTNGHVPVAAANGTSDPATQVNNHNHNSKHSLDVTGNIINGINVSDVQDLLHYWAGLVGVPLEKLAYTTFRQVESDVGKNKANGKMSDTERIAQIAGMSGGGW
ncbi:Cytosolic Fe-S cluster assembly factor nar1 [Exophiala dermatitidis]